MERYKKILHCEVLNKEVIVTYFFENVRDSNGISKTKTVEFYNCQGKNECEDICNILDCTCFKEMNRVEHEINLKAAN